MIKNDEVAIVFFFRDANIVQPYHDDIYKLLNTCDLLDIPISTNRSGSELLIIGKIRMEASEKFNQNLSQTNADSYYSS